MPYSLASSRLVRGWERETEREKESSRQGDTHDSGTSPIRKSDSSDILRRHSSDAGTTSSPLALPLPYSRLAPSIRRRRLSASHVSILTIFRQHPDEPAELFIFSFLDLFNFFPVLLRILHGCVEELGLLLASARGLDFAAAVATFIGLSEGGVFIFIEVDFGTIDAVGWKRVIRG